MVMGLLLAGIFVLVVGGGMFYLASEGKSDIRIISASAPDDISLAEIKSGKSTVVTIPQTQRGLYRVRADSGGGNSVYCTPNLSIN